MDRRRWLARACVATAAAYVAPLRAARSWSEGRLEDFDALQDAIASSYAYPEALTAWNYGIATWRRRAAVAHDNDGFLAALEGALDLLHDDHASISLSSRSLARRVPTESDVWARYGGHEARIDAVVAASDADMAGVHPGHVVTHIEGVDIDRAVDARLGIARRDPRARDWALRHLLAGPRHGAFTLALRGEPRAVVIEHEAPRPTPAAAFARRIGEKRDLAYVRVRFGHGAPPPVRQLEIALQALVDTRALVLDLRDIGDAIATPDLQAVLALFARRAGPWRIRQAKASVRVADEVGANPAAYSRPLVVLVDRWTAGDAESLAMGLRAVAEGTLLGTAMAGWRGEATPLRLPHSGLTVRFPSQRTWSGGGIPREMLQPDVAVDLAAPSGGPGDPILYQALKRLERA